MNGTCAACGCAPCTCANPSFLNGARLFDPIVSGGEFTGGTFDGPTINGGTSNGQQINGATIDCTSTVCTQPGGTCNDTIASTAFVCDAISDAIDGGNPDFCNAVNACLGIVTDFCGQVGVCLATTPNVINNPAAFDPAVYADTTTYGVVRYATLAEVQAANCELAIDPCTLGAFWSAGGPNALWTAFEAAVNAAVMGGGVFCAQVFACGAAPLASPVFTGDPQAPTPAPGDNDTSIATTAFVTDAISTAVDSGNPAFCVEVNACIPPLTCGDVTGVFSAAGGLIPGGVRLLADDCLTYLPAELGIGGGGGGGTGAGVIASGAFDITEGGGLYGITVVYSNGVTLLPVAPAALPYPYSVTINSPLPNDDYTVAISFDDESAVGPVSYPTPQLQQSPGSFIFDELPLPAVGQTLRIHFSLLSATGSIPCPVITASWPAAGAPLPGGVRLLADNCLSYTVAEALGGLAAVVAYGFNFTVVGTAGGPVVTTVGAGTVGASFVVPGGSPEILRVTFLSLRPNASYSVSIGGGVTANPSGDVVFPQVLSKTTSGFDIVFSESAAGGVAPPAVKFDFTVSQ